MNSILARQDNGNIQVTFTIPWSDVEKMMGHVLEEEGEKVTIPGFRKGKAPISKVKEKLSGSILIEKTLNHFYSHFINEITGIHKIKPAIYPRLEVLKATEEEDWQIRALTCELPQFDLGDYRKLILSVAKVNEKDDSMEKKEQRVLKALAENIKIDIPSILVEEEVNNRLSQLLSKIEKLGLQLESYLASLGKDAKSLRRDYENDAKRAISIELILGAISNKEGIKADEKEVDRAIIAAAAGQSEVEKRLNTADQRNIIKNVLQRRTVLDSLVALI